MAKRKALTAHNPSLKLVKDDPYLTDYEPELLARLDRYKQLLKSIKKESGSLKKFANAHKHLGFNYDKRKKGWYYREWAPAAEALHLVGEFNNWNRESHPLQKKEEGIWEIFLADKEDNFQHGQLYKVLVTSQQGKRERIPAYAQRVVQDNNSPNFTAQHWHKEFDWQGDEFDVKQIEIPYIYESHVGMAVEEERVGTYKEFTENVLPRLKKLGYNCVQLMAVQEHPYYGSFGYHVSSFFAASSRFGTPEELKELIRTAHSMGIAVIMDIVHSHSVKNLNEGINEFDGTVWQYFHGGGKGEHPDWDSKLFNYGKPEVLQFLLSNIRYWIEEFHFDGFRFDGVTSMMYHHHGHISFSDYSNYFDEGADVEAINYLQLANTLLHDLKPGALSIAEDVSGMPGLCRPVKEGGIGFDYRLAMGIPDFWIKMLKEKRDEDWNPWELYHVMTNRRKGEKHITYAESHDQAMVGDKTIAFWLMDKEMYWHMQKDDPNPIVERGLALHKMIRLLTMSLGGDGYLTFMGNEFGHPEWIDFPREGNNWSYKHARRQWSLAEREDLRYQFLEKFEIDMVKMAQEHQLLQQQEAKMLNADTLNTTLIFRKAGLIFIFNFHPVNSIFGYEFYLGEQQEYELVLNTDSAETGGYGRIDESVHYFVSEDSHISIYLPSRTALVLRPVVK